MNNSRTRFVVYPGKVHGEVYCQICVTRGHLERGFGQKRLVDSFRLDFFEGNLCTAFLKVIFLVSSDNIPGV